MLIYNYTMNNILIDFRKSKKKNKKYEIILLIDGKNKNFNFGSNVSKTFVEGASIQKRNNYLKRHSVNEDWNYINPGSLSAGILWGDSNDIQENLKDYMKEFNIKENIIEGGAIPKNKRLYEKVKKMMDEIYSKPSAYKSGAIVKKYEHSEQARAPHTNEPRDVPRCGALSLLQLTLHYKGG